ncbi:MAG TPA: Holliday junction resolvase RuvX [Bacillota bacterium]|nr:Holliday junction resolvase RuvX [Bacillota bacterium]HOL10567.1 Holliday junction resolvase RuvX [Bacillota bacterium]HPO98317.1 Holliday junction resolvase RuvX [Bacillota bacterium]
MIDYLILAIDPGNQKCGVAVVGRTSKVLQKQIVATSELTVKIEQILAKYEIQKIIIGDRTKSKAIKELLVPFSIPLVVVNEDFSSVEGKRRYLEENSKWWQKLLPIGLRVPDKPYDDYVAVILAERYFKDYDY